MMRLSTTVLSTMALLASSGALAQAGADRSDPAGNLDDLDITLRILPDPATTLPDEIVRRIELPPRPAGPGALPPAAGQPGSNGTGPPAGAGPPDGIGPPAAGPPPGSPGEFGRGVAERAQDLARETAEERAQAGRSIAEGAPGGPPGSLPGPPDTLPGPPEQPPGPPDIPTGPPTPPPGPPALPPGT